MTSKATSKLRIALVMFGSIRLLSGIVCVWILFVAAEIPVLRAQDSGVESQKNNPTSYTYEVTVYGVWYSLDQSVQATKNLECDSRSEAESKAKEIRESPFRRFYNVEVRPETKQITVDRPPNRPRPSADGKLPRKDASSALTFPSKTNSVVDDVTDMPSDLIDLDEFKSNPPAGSFESGKWLNTREDKIEAAKEELGKAVNSLESKELSSALNLANDLLSDIGSKDAQEQLNALDKIAERIGKSADQIVLESQLVDKAEKITREVAKVIYVGSWSGKDNVGNWVRLTLSGDGSMNYSFGGQSRSYSSPGTWSQSGRTITMRTNDGYWTFESKIAEDNRLEFNEYESTGKSFMNYLSRQ